VCENENFAEELSQSEPSNRTVCDIFTPQAGGGPADGELFRA
jgi:hypothetical protein